MAYFLDNYPVSEEGANLVLTEEQEKYCRVVYKLCEDEDGAYFSELWNPDKEYSDEYVIVSVRSTGGDPEQVNKDTLFANVKGSSKDPEPFTSGHWIDYWKTKTGYERAFCCTDTKFYNSANGAELKKVIHSYKIGDDWYNDEIDAKCNGAICGGHVIINATEAAVVKANEPVYLLPICNIHNVAHTPGGHFGEGFYMKLAYNISAVKLEGYLKEPKKYIQQIKNGG